MQQEPFWQARAEGMSGQQAAAAAGVTVHGAQQWVRRVGGVRPRRPVEPSGRFLSLADREEIAVGLAAKLTAAEIAVRIGRHRTTVSREIARNARQSWRGYRAVPSQRDTDARRRRPKPAKLHLNAPLREAVQNRLEKKWSPEQISRDLRQAFPDEADMQVSYETIYQSLYVQARGGLRRELTAHLRTGRSIRHAKRRPDAKGRNHVPKELLISERPAEVTDRAVPGHWEGDLITGEVNRSAIGTLVERHTRFLMLLHLPTDHSAEAVRDAMLIAITAMPEQLRKTVTWDQGTELAKFREITAATDMDVYFCDPHSPWQRGSNENTNGLLRQYFPKGTDLSVHTPQNLADVAAELNARPRKTLQWQTPQEVLAKLLVR